ncbi:Probable RNA-directed DNA polymerase from transposon BS [Eumeta japonica]|uniref:Probable RNA-directed DNA polymerase from transposon BS n=1 Tax=Eumeta variegata TaxID=151549 RepID=A0A4C1VGA3_EUMVA|nr:Probable RNA-directed DNA polymerase from transposon BS [Eumeta japonica]
MRWRPASAARRRVAISDGKRANRPRKQAARAISAATLMSCQNNRGDRGCSTTEAGVELIQQIFVAWENSRDAIGVFCDLSKAFDCVHHDTLIRKLHHHGVTGRSLGLLESYLSDRIQRVDINGERSSGSAVNMGVPQGSVLGPFLFLVYINDLHLVKKWSWDCIVC